MEEPTLFDRIGGDAPLRGLLQSFYGAVRLDPVIGPIFEKHIIDWNHHLAIIQDFWRTQTGAPPSYRRPFAAQHLKLGLQKEHFQLWLACWDQNCRNLLGAREAEEMIVIASQIGARLWQIVSAPREPRFGFKPLPASLR